MSIYTKTGDAGSCSLASGERISKAALRIDVYGTVDELNAHMGCCRYCHSALPEPQRAQLGRWLVAIQNDLFVVGSDLATPIGSRREGMALVGTAEVARLEAMIDSCQSEISPLSRFVLPGGSELAALLHVCRTVCRRAERLAVALASGEELNPQLIPFLNRLSDLLFVVARWVLHHAGADELFWEKRQGLCSLAD
jgi:cob(I)alamin adenosyltransferase